MTAVTKDPCYWCERRGLLVEQKGKEERRRCVYCGEAEPRPFDRYLYLACTTRIRWDHDQRRQQHWMDGRMSVEPFFDKKEADTYLFATRERMAASDPVAWSKWEPIVVQHKFGMFSFGRGDATFLFVDTKLVDLRPLLDCPSSFAPPWEMKSEQEKALGVGPRGDT